MQVGILCMVGIPKQSASPSLLTVTPLGEECFLTSRLLPRRCTLGWTTPEAVRAVELKRSEDGPWEKQEQLSLTVRGEESRASPF